MSLSNFQGNIIKLSPRSKKQKDIKDWSYLDSGDTILICPIDDEKTFEAVITRKNNKNTVQKEVENNEICTDPKPPIKSKPKNISRPSNYSRFGLSGPEDINVSLKTTETEEEEKERKMYEVLEKTGLLEAYSGLLNTISLKGPPEGEDIFEFAAKEIENFGHLWQEKIINVKSQ